MVMQKGVLVLSEMTMLMIITKVMMICMTGMEINWQDEDDEIHVDDNNGPAFDGDGGDFNDGFDHNSDEDEEDNAWRW